MTILDELEDIDELVRRSGWPSIANRALAVSRLVKRSKNYLSHSNSCMGPRLLLRKSFCLTKN
jgi:hypothetical protein